MYVCMNGRTKRQWLRETLREVHQSPLELQSAGLHTYIQTHTYIKNECMCVCMCMYVCMKGGKPDPTAISKPISPAGFNSTDASKSVQQTT
jgi:hypothetical protein